MSSVAHLTLAEYERMIAAGVFEPSAQRRLEFVRGEIRQMTPIGTEHIALVLALQGWSQRNLPLDRALFLTQNALRLSTLGSILQPDLAWLVRRDYLRRPPAAEDVLLLIEVSDSSLAYDTGEKAALYAEAGIADYWVVDVAQRTIEVRRQPHGREYQSVQRFQDDQEVRPLCRSEAVLQPASLWVPLA